VDGTYDNPLAPLETNKHCYSKDVESQPPQESKQGGAVLLFVHPAFGDHTYQWSLPSLVKCLPADGSARLSLSSLLRADASLKSFSLKTMRDF